MSIHHKNASHHGRGSAPVPVQQRRDMVFVFGSNTAGIHGAGAARAALLQYGAVMGVGVGHVGNSYALPTKGAIKRINSVSIGPTLPLVLIKDHVEDFIRYARQHPELKFQITQLGCGLAGLKPEWIAPMFKTAPENCYFDTQWQPYLPERAGDPYRFWGSF
jgi:hypothetical protein